MNARSSVPSLLAFPSGEERPTLGLGTWRLGENPAAAAAEVRILRLALDIGYRVFDTAEMYADGGAEAVLGRALVEGLRQGLTRDELFVVSKLLPSHASASDVEAACERSLNRLGLDHIDLYLLHWRGSVSLADTVRGFERLQRRGLIRLWGVSNFDLDDMRELSAVPGGASCAANQVHYSLSQRGIEWDLLPWQRLQQMPLMAYSPLDRGVLADHPALLAVAERHRVTPAQVALAWVIRKVRVGPDNHQGGVMAIPKAGSAVHLRHNWSAALLTLGEADLATLDRAFAPPQRKLPLSML
jgi:diketogulonate reductase-like aldo/keto reductase